MIPASKVTEMLAAAGLDSAEELLPKLLADARSMALPTISGFLVGAAALGESGAIYLGANLEFPAQQLNQSVHAEQFAIVNAARNGELRIVRICVNETPCGHCRQFMQELPHADELKVHVNKPNAVTDGVHDLSTLLPFAFGPGDLGIHHAHGLFSASLVELPLTIPTGTSPKRSTNLSKQPATRSSAVASPGRTVPGETNGAFVDVDVTTGTPLAPPTSPGRSPTAKRARAMLVGDDFKRSVRAHAALAAAQAYAPYSQCPAGIAASCDDGTVVVASSYESCAYNPSISLMQTLLIAMVLEFTGAAPTLTESSETEPRSADVVKAEALEKLSMLISKLQYVCVVEQAPLVGRVGVAHGSACESLLVGAGAHAQFEVLEVPAPVKKLVQ